MDGDFVFSGDVVVFGQRKSKDAFFFSLCHNQSQLRIATLFSNVTGLCFEQCKTFLLN